MGDGGPDTYAGEIEGSPTSSSLKLCVHVIEKFSRSLQTSLNEYINDNNYNKNN